MIRARPSSKVVGIALAALTVAVLFCSLSLCQSPAANAPHADALDTDRSILRRGNGPEPESLDPQSARSEAALTILRDLYEGLTAIGADGTPIMAAAERCDISADGLTYRFHLRAAGRWSNGEKVVAEDFAAAWRRLVDPRTAAPYADILSPVAGANAITAGIAAPDTLGVQAENPLTLVVRLDHRTPYFLKVLALPATYPINRPSLVAHGRAFAKPGVMVSNGAFTLTRWDFGSHLIAARSFTYWNDAHTTLDGVEYYSFADAASELRAFRTGELDVTASIPAAQANWVRANFSHALQVAPQLAVYYLGLNLKKRPFASSRELRQALSMVIDRDRLVQVVTGGGEVPAYTFVPNQTFDYTPALPAYAHWTMPQRVSRARALLREAGFAQQLPVLELRYNTGELHNRIAVAVAEMWKQALGITTALRAEEFKVLLQDIDRGDVEVFRASWIADYDDAYSFLQLLQSGSGINLPHYSSLAYDNLLRGAGLAEDRGERRNLLQQAEALMLDDQPVIPLYFYVSAHLVADGVHGWRNNPLNVIHSKALTKSVAGAN